MKEKKFINCTVCGRKIGWFRKWRTRQLDKDPLHLIPLQQFCCNNCAGKGLAYVMKNVRKKKQKNYKLWKYLNNNNENEENEDDSNFERLN